VFVGSEMCIRDRAHKIALTLSQAYEVLLVGIRTPKKYGPVPKRPYEVRRLFVPVNKGPLFFLLANVRFFFFLLFLRRWEAVVVADLDALLGAYGAAWLRRKQVILDSRELYPGLPSLGKKPLKRWVWQKAETWLYPRVRYHFTVSPPIATHHKSRYGVESWVIYNLPFRQRGFAKTRLEDKLLFYQGVLHAYRGLEEAILALKLVPDWRLWIAGDGDHRPYLEAIVRQEKLQERVLFFGQLPYEACLNYAREATLGISGEIPVSDNHRFALPNKVFDYIQVGLPILAGEAPLVGALVGRLEVGHVVRPWEPRTIAAALREIELRREAYHKWASQAREAARKLSWEAQAPCLLCLLEKALSREPLTHQHEASECVFSLSMNELWTDKLCK